MFRLIAVFFFIIPIVIFGQVKNLGVPQITNYSKQEYRGGTQNWSIAQDSSGFIYFANNDGLLCYNGVNWDLTRISTTSPLRSVFVDSKNSLYVGLINDFGLVQREEPNAPEFTSFKKLLPDSISDFDDIWRIHETSGEIVFQSYKYLFLYKNGKIQVLKPENSFYSTAVLDSSLLMQEPGIGAFELVNGMKNKVTAWEQHKEKNIRTVLETSDHKILVGTESHGIFVLHNDNVSEWDTPANNFVIKNRLYCASSIGDKYLVFGTILNGVIITDNEGNIVKNLNKENGLQNNTVLNLFVDSSENLWLGLDNGIDFIELSSPLSFIGNKKIGAGYSCRVFQGKLYLGTNQGLYVCDFDESGENPNFELVQNTVGQVWSLDEFDGELICGHNLGTFRVEGSNAVQISSEEGAWKYMRLNNNSNFLIGGHYNGLVLLKKENGKWRFNNKISGFDESSRYICQDNNNNIWIGHGGKGIYKLRLNRELNAIESVFHYTEKQGLPSNTGNILFQFGSGIFVSTVSGNYKYDNDLNKFLPSAELNNLFGEYGKIKTLSEGPNNEFWFISENEAGLLRRNEDLTYTRITSPFRGLNEKFVNEFEFIFPYNDKNIFLGSEDGFIHYSPVITKLYNKNYRSYISKIELSYLDSVIYIYGSKTKGEFQFPFRKNSFRFNFSATFFENNKPLEFSYFLEGFSDEWSVWSTDTYRDFTTLHEGEYTFALKAKNIYGVESEPAYFSFRILPPWHKSVTAYIAYVLLLFLIAFITSRYILYRIKRSQQFDKDKHQKELLRKEEQHKQESLVAETQIVKLRNEKLRAEMIHRDKELANQTMAIIHKNKFLIKVNDDLNAIQDYIINETATGKIYNLKNRIKREIDIKQQNQIFETYFDEVHEEFFEKLKEKYPLLSPNDLRICAFIKMNLTTQEIAAILNISYRGAEISRYRLRKKLDLDRSTNLSTFLSNI